MADVSSIYDQYRNMQFNTTAPPPANLMASPSMANPTPSLPAGSLPQVSKSPTPLQNTLTSDINRRNQVQAAGPGEEQLYHKITGSNFGQNHPLLGKLAGGTAAGVAGLGDIALSSVAPGTASMIPGTILGHQGELNRANKAVTQDEANAEKEAQTEEAQARTGELNARPELNQAKLDLATEKQHSTEASAKQKLDAQLAQHGYKHDVEGNIVPLTYQEMSPQQQAITDLRGSQEELANARKDYVKAEKDNIPLQMELAQQRIATAQRNASTAAQRLGLSAQEFEFNQEKFYNPQPTATERKTADLATSAINQVHAIREVMRAHPDYFGPGGAAKQKLAAWLSSDAEDAGKFKAAANYLAEHSAGVFGGRGAYIIQQLKDITNPNQNISALTGALDEAEQTAQHFATRGQTHGKGGAPNPAPPETPKRPQGVPDNAQYITDSKTGKKGWAW